MLFRNAFLSEFIAEIKDLIRVNLMKGKLNMSKIIFYVGVVQVLRL